MRDSGHEAGNRSQATANEGLRGSHVRVWVAGRPMIDAAELWSLFVRELAKTRGVKSRLSNATYIKPIHLNEKPSDEILQALSVALAKGQ